MHLNSHIFKILRELYRNRVVLKRKYKNFQFNYDNNLSINFDDFKKQGLCTIPNYLTEEQCNYLINVIDGEWESMDHKTIIDISDKCKNRVEFRFGVIQPNGIRYWIDQEQSDRRIVDAHLLNKIILNFWSDAELLNFGEYFLKVKLEPMFTIANRVEYKVNNRGSGGGWHRDNVYSNGFKAMIYLNDVNHQNGAFEFLPGTHRSFNHLFHTDSFGKYQFSDEEIKIHKNKEKKVVAKAGTLVLFDTNLIHRGSPVMPENRRYALTNYYSFLKL